MGYINVGSASSSVFVLQYEVPTDGGTVTIDPASDIVVMAPAGALTTLTVVFPDSPPDGRVIRLCEAANGIVSLTLSSATATFSGITAGLAANGFSAYVYRASTLIWYRCG